MKDLALSSKWSITLHDPSAPHLPCVTLGQFKTIFGFWQIYNVLMEKNFIQTLPTRVNITIYRENLQSKPNAINQWHGEWNIELCHDTEPLEIYRKIILLVIGEQLTNKIRGLVLHRVPLDDGHINFSISIFTDHKNPEIDVKNILLSKNVIDLNYCINNKAIFHPYQIIHIPSQQSSASEQKESEEIDDNIPYVKYSLESLLQYSQLMENGAPAAAVVVANESSAAHNKYRDAAHSLFGEHAESYNISICNQVSETLRDILYAEGCVICTQTSLESPYDKKQSERKSNAPDTNPSFVIVQCPSLGCQHIIHCKCISNAADNVVIRGNHCSDFFETIDLTNSSRALIQKEIGCYINTNNATGKKYQFSFKINHLISDKNTVSPQWPITIPSYYKDKDKSLECLQIFFDHTELQVLRGTIQIAVSEDTEDRDKKSSKRKKNDQEEKEFDEDFSCTPDIFVHRANFEIPNLSKHMQSNVANKIYQLRYTDEATNNTLIININLQLKPKYAAELLSLRYELNSLNSCEQKTDEACFSTSTMDHTDFVCSSDTGTLSTLEVSSMPHFITISAEPAEMDMNSSPALSLNSNISASSSLSTAVQFPVALTMPMMNTMNFNHDHHNIHPPSLHPMNIGNMEAVHNHSALNHSGINLNALNNHMIMLQQQQQQHTQVPQLPQVPQMPPQCSPHSLLSSNLYLFENIAAKFNNPLQLYQYACSPLGSHYIATKVKYPAYFSMFFDKLIGCFPSLMVHCYGHTVSRSIYSQPHCSLANKIVLLESLIPNFSEIASNRQGSFALICIMSLMTTNAEIETISKAFDSIIQSNKGNSDKNLSRFDDVILSQSGYHVIKKFIGFGYPHFNCILKGISADFTKYATHHYGVPIIRSMLDTIGGNSHFVKEYAHFLQLFAQHTHSLVYDQYGNYVIQQLLEISPYFVTDTIKEFMVSKYSEYSKHKFASNVVEKCLKHTLREYHAKNITKSIESAKKNGKICYQDNEEKDAEISVCANSAERRNWSNVIIRELLCDANSLINHKYGNYCLQTALSVCIESKSYVYDGGTLLKEFVQTTQSLLHLLRMNVRKKWQQLLLSAAHMLSNNNFIDSHNNHLH